MAEAAPVALIVGATSAMAEAVARRLASRGQPLALAARDPQRLDSIAADLRVRGAPRVSTFTVDMSRVDELERFVDQAWSSAGPFDTVLVAHGTLPDQRACEADVGRLRAELMVNFTATLTLLTLLAGRLQPLGRGTIGVITSVAGDRGRQSNHVYGAAKGGVSIFLQGLRHRLAPHGVRVVDIKPGFVDTPMTASFPKGPLWATPERVAADIDRALQRGTPVLYTPGFWRLIMWVVRSLPLALFHRTRL